MATLKKSLLVSSHSFNNMENVKIAIVVSKWNDEITDALYQCTIETLKSKGVSSENIIKKQVPGSFELPLGAQMMAMIDDIDAVICLGCVIQGETRHFEFIASAVANGIAEVALKYNKPVIFGVLTTDTHQQAMDRAGGKYGNKGEEAAITALRMISFQ